MQEIFRGRQPVDAGHTGDDDGVRPGQQRADGGKPEPFDLFVDRRILFNVGVRARDISFRLIIIEIADEVFDGVAREKLFELAVKLRRQRLVVGHDKGRPVKFPNDIGDGERLPGTCDP